MTSGTGSKPAILLCLVLVIFMLSLFVSNVQLRGISQPLYPVNSRPYNTSYGDWLAKWWQWFIGIPANDHPTNNPLSPDKCSLHQQGPVWFLPDKPEGTGDKSIVFNCTIPQGKAIGFTIETGECDSGMREVGNNLGMMATCATKGNLAQYVANSLRATFDGVDLKNLQEFRVQSNPFNISIPESNYYGADAGTFNALASGYFYILSPLSPGKHTLVVHDNVINPLEKGSGVNHVKTEIFKLLVK
jgi:hypothetical protein